MADISDQLERRRPIQEICEAMSGTLPLFGGAVESSR
jgi:hypothetical protein